MNVNEIVNDAQENLRSFTEARKNLQYLQGKLVEDIASLEQTLSEVRSALGEAPEVTEPQEATEAPSKAPSAPKASKDTSKAPKAPEKALEPEESPVEEESAPKEDEDSESVQDGSTPRGEEVSEVEDGNASREITAEEDEAPAEEEKVEEEPKKAPRKSSSRRSKAAAKEETKEEEVASPGESDDALEFLETDAPAPPQVDDVFASALNESEDDGLLDLSFASDDDENYDEPPF